MAKSESKAEDAKSRPSSAGGSQSSSKAAAKPAALKREKSDLFSSFAKAKPKKKTSTPAESVGHNTDFSAGFFSLSGVIGGTK